MGGRGELGPSTGRGVRCGGQGGGSRRGTRLRTVLPKPLRATRWTPARRSVTTHGVQPRFGVRVAQRTRSGAEEEMPELRVPRASTVARSCFSARPCAHAHTRAHMHAGTHARSVCMCTDEVHGLGARRGRERCGSAFCACHSGGTRTCQRRGRAARGRALPEPCRAAGRRRPPRGAADAPLSGSDIYSHFASLIIPTSGHKRPRHWDPTPPTPGGCP